MLLKNVFTQFFIAFFEDDARNKKQKPKFFFRGRGAGVETWDLQLTSSVCKQLYLSSISKPS